MKHNLAVTKFLDESNAIEGVFDVQSLDQALFAWEYISQQKEITPGVVLKTHKILMLNQNLRPHEKGYFRRCQVWVGGRQGTHWSAIDDAMQVWCMNAWLFPEHWQEHHVRFEVIHPFVDGNGRVGRILMNWQRLKAGLPILIIEEAKKQDYYEWFRSKK